MRREHRLLSSLAIGALTAGMALSACSSDTTGSHKSEAGPTRSEAIAQITDDVILPGLAKSATTTTALGQAVTKLCSSPDEPSLAAARDAWSAAQVAWMETSAYRVGPIGELHSRAKIAYPVNTEKLEALLAGGQIDLSKLDDLGAHLRGLGGIEYVLFHPQDVSQLEASRCAYAEAAAVSVKAGAAELADAWTDGYAKEFKDSGQDAIDQLVNASLSSLATVDDMTLGDKAPEANGLADHRLADGVAELASVTEVWGAAPNRLAGLVESKSSSAAKAFESPLRSAKSALASLTSLDDSPARTAAAEDVNDARVALRTEVSSQLGVTVTFTDADGDG